MRRVIVLATLALIMAAGTALADSIDGRFGITGKAGALVPLQDDFISDTSGTDPGLAAGGGFILGFGKNFAAELDVTRLLKADVNVSGSKAGEASLTDIALGLQYRFAPDNRLVPFIGVGADFIKGELESTLGSSTNLDWTVGGHANLGFDFFVTRGIALTADARGLYAADGDVRSSGEKIGTYQPISFIGTVGIRLFLPEHPFD
jgi:outer membrane protein